MAEFAEAVSVKSGENVKDRADGLLCGFSDFASFFVWRCCDYQWKMMCLCLPFYFLQLFL